MPRKLLRMLGRRTVVPAAPGDSNDLFAVAQDLFSRQMYSEARMMCRQLLEDQPDHIDALLLSADIAVKQHEHLEALRLYAAAADQQPDRAHACYKRGNIFKDLGDMEAALDSYNLALARDPRHSQSLCNRGVVLERLGRPEDALRSYDEAIALNPDDCFSHYNRGLVLQALSRLEEALISYDHAISVNVHYAEAYCNRGILLSELNRTDQALDSYAQCLKIRPDFSQAYFNRATLFKKIGKADAALRDYDRAIEINPAFSNAYANRGVLFAELKRWDDAFASFDQAITLRGDFAEVYANRGNAYLTLNRFREAIMDYDRALAIKPDFPFLAGARLHAKMNLSDWKNFDSELLRLAADVELNLSVSPPHYVFALFDSPRLQRKAAEAWVRSICPSDLSLGPLSARRRGEKLRIGYFSADFRHHALAHLIAELIETHDRSQFEVIGFSFGPNTQDQYRKRFESTFDQFLDVRGQTDRDVALLARKIGIDIAIDLGGHTHESKTGIFALRAAPLQVSYLGYPGTMGADYFDYMIADNTVVPPGAEVHFVEKIVFLPHSYQPNNSKRVTSSGEVKRSDLGLPDDAFVFCSFNNNYKILPSIFGCWMRILKMVPGSVLWLLENNADVSSNLRQQALAAGVDPQRLISAPRAPFEKHIARHRGADLFLDTLPCNAHTTASDALWAGLPILTWMGESFAARVAASLVLAMDLPELVVANVEDYEQTAVELALSPARLAAIKAKLSEGKYAKPLFDTVRYTRNFESALLSIQARHDAGLPPANLQVPL